MAGLGQDLLINGEMYFDNTVIPQNTTKESDVILATEKGIAGSFNVKAVVAKQIQLADAKTITLKLQDSANGTDFEDVTTLYTNSASGSTTIPAGAVLCEFVLPPTIRKWTRLSISTDDASATGNVNAYPQYMPR
jgi:hypothetical protein